jgi:hypothetical protein
MPTFETINKAFEVEILQNKIKPCIVEKPVHHSISWRKYENHQGLSGRMFSTLEKQCKYSSDCTRCLKEIFRQL